MTPCGETQRQVLGRIVHRPNHRASAYEKYKDTWRTDKRKGGKGMTENQRLVWILSMPVCANINETMQKFSGVSHETSDQHKDASAARQARYVSDTVDLIDLSMREIRSFRMTRCLTLPMVRQLKKEAMLRRQERSE